jgi:hypothetical protein
MWPRECGRWSTGSAPGEFGQLLEGDRVHERVGMPVHDPPCSMLSPKHERRSQRPILCRRAADLAMLTLDDHEDGEVS